MFIHILDFKVLCNFIFYVLRNKLSVVDLKHINIHFVIVFPSRKILKPKEFLLSKGRIIIFIYNAELQECLQAKPQSVFEIHPFTYSQG